MAVAVIDAFEVIEIELDNRKRLILRKARFRGQTRAFKECAAVVQARQRVIPGAPFQRALHGQHIAHHTHDHPPGDKQHSGKEQPQQAEHHRHLAEPAFRALRDCGDFHQHAIEIGELRPGDKPGIYPRVALVIKLHLARQHRFILRREVQRGIITGSGRGDRA